MTARHFADSNVLLLAVGGTNARRHDCRRILEAATEGVIHLHVSAEAIQEFMHHRLRRTDRVSALGETRRVHALTHTHPIDESVIDGMIELVATTSLRGRDAVHAATALQAGFTSIISADTDFDDIPGLTRIDPSNF